MNNVNKSSALQRFSSVQDAVRALPAVAQNASAIQRSLMAQRKKIDQSLPSK